MPQGPGGPSARHQRPAPLSADARYARQVVMPTIGEAGQALISDSRVVVIGLGGLGTPAATYLAGAGVGELRLVDYDTVSLSNLHRQFLYREDDVGQPKAEVAAERLRAYNPAIQVNTHTQRLSDALFATLLPDAQIVLDCTDNFPTRFAINAACARFGVPLVLGAGIGSTGQLGVFRHDRKDSGCYRCLFDESGEVAEACEDAGVFGPLVGMIGAWQAFESLRLLIGESPAHSSWLHFAPETRTIRHHQIPQDPACPCHV